MLVPLPGGGKREALLAKNQRAIQAVQTDEVAAPAPTMPARSQRADAESLAKDRLELPKVEKRQAAPRPAQDAKALLADKNVLAPERRELSSESFAAVVTPQLANERKAAEMQLAGAASTAAQGPVGRAIEPVTVRYGAGGKADASVGVPLAPAPAASPALPMEVASAPAPEATALQAADKPGQPRPTYRSVATSAAAERPK